MGEEYEEYTGRAEIELTVDARSDVAAEQNMRRILASLDKNPSTSLIEIDVDSLEIED